MFSLITFNLHVTFHKTKSSETAKVEIPVTDEQVDRNKKSIPKTTLVDWWKLVGIVYYLLRLTWWIIVLINS